MVWIDVKILLARSFAWLCQNFGRIKPRLRHALGKLTELTVQIRYTALDFRLRVTTPFQITLEVGILDNPTTGLPFKVPPIYN